MKTSQPLLFSFGLMTCFYIVSQFELRAEEQGNIESKMIAEQEIVDVNEKGKKELKREPVSNDVPSDPVEVGAGKQGSIELKMIAEQEIVVENEEGEKELKREPVANIVPGDHVFYTIEYKNIGQEMADQVDIKNPIPIEMEYVSGTADGSEANILFSIDGGKTFDKPENLIVFDEEGNEHLATAKEYTHIRWMITKSVEPGAEGQVTYRAALKQQNLQKLV